jgi:hypothetical protein
MNRSYAGSARIRDLGTPRERPRRQRVWARANAACDLPHRDPSDEEPVGNQRSMTAPWNSLSAHQDDTLLRCQLDRSVQASPESRCLHVVGITPKTGISPPGVWGVLSSTPAATQPGEVAVMDPKAMERPRQSVAIELRIVPRHRNRAYVDHSAHAVQLEKANELLYRPCRVPDRQNDEW